MNEELQKQLAEYLGTLLEAAKSGAAFASEQVPLVIQEKIVYGRVVETLTAVIGVVGLIGLPLFACKAIKNLLASEDIPYDKHEESNRLVIQGFGYVVLAFMSLIALMFLDHIGSAIKAWTAPRLYIIEWLSSLV